MRRLLALAALALAACSSDPVDEEEAEPPATPNETDETLTAIPDAFLGVWDYVEGSCNPASDLRVEIAPMQVTFYESVGEVEAVEGGADEVTVVMQMSGEGETWRNEQVFRLADGGSILETDDPAPGGEGKLRRSKCPA